MRLRDLREHLLADAQIVGDENAEVRGLRAFDGTFEEDEMTYITASRASAEQLRSHKATVFITDLPREAAPLGKSFIHTPRPRLQMAKLSHVFAPPARDFTQAPENVAIAPTAKVHPRAVIASDVTIGDDTVIHANVTIHSRVVVGKRCILHAGVVLGTEGFGYEHDDDGSWFRIAHLGGVRIGDDVEIGANACVDRGTLGDTVIQDGAKLDNLVHVAHNVRIGKRAMICANVIFCGSSSVGEDAWIAPGACIKEGKRVGARSVVGLGSVVVRDVEEGVTVMGPIAERLLAPRPSR